MEIARLIRALRPLPKDHQLLNEIFTIVGCGSSIIPIRKMWEKYIFKENPSLSRSKYSPQKYPTSGRGFSAYEGYLITKKGEEGKNLAARQDFEGYSSESHTLTPWYPLESLTEFLINP